MDTRKPVLTESQRGRFEHRLKIGMIETLYNEGLIDTRLFMEAVRIQKEKDRKYFVEDAS